LKEAAEKIRSVEKFLHPGITADGQARATVELQALKTLWFNTGTLCNIACSNCYIESTPTNDRLSYLSLEEVVSYLDEIQAGDLATEEIGITGGEPFMNPDIVPIMQACLSRGFRLLVLTNAMRPMMRPRIQAALLDLHKHYGQQLTLRVSVDHFNPELHEEERGANTWQPMLKGLKWLAINNFNMDIAGRTRWGEDESQLRAGFAALFARHGVAVDAYDAKCLMLFPEMDEAAEVPEITSACWDILGVNPDDQMCASARMVVKHKGAVAPSVMACTLLAYDDRFDLGSSLATADKSVPLNHPHCAKFCVLGGGSCSA
jgi:uncharacterized Fe-S cluster-containing radical SAM superfamily protein